MTDTELRNKIREAVRTALLESAVAPTESSAPSAYFAPWTGVSYEAHPSQQKFDIAEASQQIAAQLGNLLEFTSAQNCTIEKGKPCDQCGMCRSLGF
ncbi:MAG: hypothetical protein SF097_02330 [Acidobacteriota bacterium]|nr:hypothetical protein [Acidobacteriota bacterium]